MAETKTINLEVNSNLNQTTERVASLKAELRKAQAEVAAMSDKFGATSKEAINAAKRAAELKDQIGDAKALTDSFNPDAKFKALAGAANIAAGALSGFEGAMGLVGVKSEEAQEAILKVQSALALSQGISALQEIPDTFRNIKAVAIDAFQGIKAAIGSTGIGLLVVALGTIVTYWDDIKEAVSGVSDEQKKINTTLNENAKKSKEQLDTLDAQDETLKRQGKSEREILEIKQKQTQEVINAQIEAIKNNALIREQQEKAAAKNKEILKGMLDFIAYPLVNLLKTIDAIGEKFGKTFGLAEKFKESTANLLFNPEKIKQEAELAKKEEQKALNELINKRDGYVNQIKTIDDNAAKEAAEKLEEKKKKEKEYTDSVAKGLIDLQIATDEANLKQRELDNQDKQLRLEAFDEFTKQQNEIEQRNYEYEKSLDEAKLAQKRAIEEAKMSLLTSSLGLAKNLFEKNKGVQKAIIIAENAMALASLTRSTVEAVGKDNAASPLTGGMPWAGIHIAQGALGAANIIMSTTKALSAVGGGSAGSAPTMGTAQAAPRFNVVGNAGVNQIAETMNRQAQSPIQAYVVANNVTTAQSLNRNIVQNASLG